MADKKNPFRNFRARELVIQGSRLQGVPYRVLIAIAEHVHDQPGPYKGLSWPGRARLAIEAHCSMSAVQRAFPKIMKSGEAICKTKGGGGRQFYVWRLDEARLEAGAAAVAEALQALEQARAARFGRESNLPPQRESNLPPVDDERGSNLPPRQGAERGSNLPHRGSKLPPELKEEVTAEDNTSATAVELNNYCRRPPLAAAAAASRYAESLRESLARARRVAPTPQRQRLRRRTRTTRTSFLRLISGRFSGSRVRCRSPFQEPKVVADAGG